jgi:23S rRNA (guanosine2251-2'-O)-methyltransferase
VDASPRDTFVTLYGRQPVLEALGDDRITFDKVLVSRSARGEHIDEIVEAARSRGVPLRRVEASRITRISRNGRHDQGVVADVVMPGLGELDDFLVARPTGPASLLLLDGVSNPANVGMVIRTVAAAGLDATVLPRAGSPDVGPLVIKASAGVALRANVLRTDTAASAVEALGATGVTVLGLGAGHGRSLFESEIPERVAFVLGNETDGIGPAVAGILDGWVSLPLATGVESLNVAAAAAVVAYEVVRRRVAGG